MNGNSLLCMIKNKIFSFVFCFLLLLVSLGKCVYADQEPNILTKSGKGFCEIEINGRSVLKYECKGFYPPSLLNSSYLYESNEKVFVFIDNPMGNACDGGPIHVISQSNDGKYEPHKAIDFCGGHFPTIVTEPAKLSILIPSIEVDGISEKIPSENWIFENNELTKAHYK